MNSPTLFLSAALLLAAVSVASSGMQRSPLDRSPASAAARQNPYEHREDARQAGEKLFHLHCASCHGVNGGGRDRTPALATLRVKKAAPGALFWVLRNGSLRRGMPSFSHLPEQQRWQIVTFLGRLSDGERTGRGGVLQWSRNSAVASVVREVSGETPVK